MEKGVPEAAPDPQRERIERGLRAGVEMLELYARLHEVPLAEARAILERNKQVGRTPCSFLDRD